MTKDYKLILCFLIGFSKKSHLKRDKSCLGGIIYWHCLGIIDIFFQDTFERF